MPESVHLLGVPSDLGTNADTAPVIDSRHGPAALRRSLDDLLRGYELFNPIEDAGDIDCGANVQELLSAVQRSVEQRLSQQQKFMLIGGAHTLTLGALRALAAQGRQYSLLYFDAHPDILPEAQVHYGSTLFHAIEEGALDPARLVYIGIRQIEEPEREQIRKHGILSFSSLDVFELGTAEISSRIHAHCSAPWYLSIDLDGLDLSYAPGITTPSPFGMSPREVLSLALEFSSADTIGAEIVELAPANDLNERTARLGASLLFEVARKLSGIA